MLFAGAEEVPSDCTATIDGADVSSGAGGASGRTGGRVRFSAWTAGRVEHSSRVHGNNERPQRFSGSQETPAQGQRAREQTGAGTDNSSKAGS